jgi:methylmalonyl-CoA mutase N-terminal domain/subunit
VEALTAALTTQSWEALILADQYDELTAFTPLIAQKREARIERHHTGQQLLIGVNQFENTFETKIKQWANIPTYLGFPYLIYELV